MYFVCFWFFQCKVPKNFFNGIVQTQTKINVPAKKFEVEKDYLFFNKIVYVITLLINKN